MSQRGQAFFASSAKYSPPGPPPITVTFISFLPDHRRGFDLEARLGLDQAPDLHHGHGREVLAHQLAIGRANRFQRIQIFLAVEHVPRQPHDVLRPAVRFFQDFQNIEKTLPELAGEVVRFPLAFAGPADLAGDEHQRSAGGDAVGKALGACPARRLKNFHFSVPLSLKRCSFPVSVRGSVSTNSIARGYLYGAITFLTCSCNDFFVSAFFSLPGFSTTNALTTVPRSASGAPITPHSATAACESSALSTSGPAML